MGLREDYHCASWYIAKDQAEGAETSHQKGPHCARHEHSTTVTFLRGRLKLSIEGISGAHHSSTRP
jgi:hypothetical protein